MKKQIALSGIAKKAILDCYLAMKEYMHDENLEDEEKLDRFAADELYPYLVSLKEALS